MSDALSYLKQIKNIRVGSDITEMAEQRALRISSSIEATIKLAKQNQPFRILESKTNKKPRGAFTEKEAATFH